MLWLALDFGGNRWAWDSATIIGLLCGSVATFAVFAAWSHRKGDRAMLPFSTLRLRVVWSSCLTILMLAGTLLVLTYYLPLYFQGVRGDTPFLSGVHFLPTAVTQVVLTLISGRLSKSSYRLFLGINSNSTAVQVLGYYLPFLLIGGTLGTIGSGLMTLISPSLSLAKIVGFQVLAGVGRGIAFPMVSSIFFLHIQTHHPHRNQLTCYTAYDCPPKLPSTRPYPNRNLHLRLLPKPRRRPLHHRRTNRLLQLAKIRTSQRRTNNQCRSYHPRWLNQNAATGYQRATATAAGSIQHEYQTHVYLGNCDECG